MASRPTTGAFPKFSLLPSELRLRIWQESLPPRVVEFPHVPLEDKMALWEAEICDDPSAPRPESDTVSLSVLGASYESYNLLIRLYKDLFTFEVPETGYDVFRNLGVHWTRVYQGVRFNPKIDTLSISTEFCPTMTLHGREALTPLRFVSVYIADTYKRTLPRDVGVELEFPSVMGLFLAAPNLETICLEFGCPESWIEGKEFVLPDYYVASLEGALKDYWDTWRDTEGREMYTQDDDGRVKAQGDRERWRNTVSVAIQKTPFH